MSEFAQGWRRLKEDHYGNAEIIKTLIGLLGIGVALYLLSKTNINVLGFLVLPAIGMGLLATLRWPKKASEFYGHHPFARFMLGWTVNTVVWGGIYASLLLLLNTYLPYSGNSESIEKRLQITDKGSLIGETRRTREKRRAVFYVDWNGTSKGFTFSHDYYQKMDSFHYLLVRYNKGALGFDRVEEIVAMP